VYTHDREVNAMLDLVPDMFPTQDDPGNADRTFLEPACGHGNFLVEILRRKLAYVTTSRYGTGERFEYRVLRALSSIYGIDISPDNVSDARDRMWRAIETHLAGLDVSVGFTDSVRVILGTNLICADTLSDARHIELIEYKPVGASKFVRTWSYLDDGEPDLFSEAMTRRDEAPVHYAKLIAQPDPLLAG
jgi:hypothetical protein